MAGDDIEDDFPFIADSGDEEGDNVDADVEGLLSADEEDQKPVVPRDQATVDKKRKRRAQEKEKKQKKIKLAESKQPAEAISVAAYPPQALSEYLATKQAITFSQLSAIELEDIQIPVSSIADTTSWTESRTLDHLVDFIIQVVPTLHSRLSMRSKSLGAPTLLFVTGAALRVTDVTRVLKDVKLRGQFKDKDGSMQTKGGDVAKLFSKHFKLEAHVQYLKRTKIGSAAGTPGRIGKLLCETDAISLAALTHIFLDVTWVDAKKRGLLDIPETRDEVFKTVLGAPKVMEGIKEGKITVVLF